MFFYIMPYIFIVFMALMSYKVRSGGYKVLFFIGLIPFALLVALRGEVGTDTNAYIKLLSNSIYELKENNSGLEPFFLMIIYLKNYFELNSQLVLNVFSLFILLVLFIFFLKTKHRFFIFSLLIFPIFIYDMSMNGVRYGMAFALSCFFIAESKEKLYKINNNKFIYFLSLLNHKTAILFYFFKNAQSASIKNFFIICLIMIIGFFVLQEYMVDKFSLYSEYSSPSIFSGVQPLFLTFLVLMANSYFYSQNLKRNIYLLIIQLIFYIITQVSYAGIRFQFLELFYILVILVNDDGKIRKYKLYLLVLFFIGFLGLLFRLKNFNDESGIGLSPFIPYKFFWEK